LGENEKEEEEEEEEEESQPSLYGLVGGGSGVVRLSDGLCCVCVCVCVMEWQWRGKSLDGPSVVDNGFSHTQTSVSSICNAAAPFRALPVHFSFSLISFQSSFVLFLFCFCFFRGRKEKFLKEKKRERKTKSRKIESIKRNGV
jgi:hypothetical protein